MKYTLVVVAVAACIGVAACESGAPPENRTEIKVANPGHEALLKLTSLNQRLALMRALRDNGRRCTRVDGARYQEDYRGMVMWVALCSDQRHWAIFIAPNGDTQVRECGDMAQLRLPQCRPVVAVPESENDMNNL